MQEWWTMKIEHRANVFCLITGGSTVRGKARTGQGCWLYKYVAPGECVQEFGYHFQAYDEPMWIVAFVDTTGSQSASFFEEKNLLPLCDGNNPRSPDEMLRLEHKPDDNDDGESV